MFRVVESISSPIRFSAKPGIKIVSGNLIKISDYFGVPVADVSDGHSVFGITSSSKSLKSFDAGRNGMINIWVQRMVFRTDLLDFDYHYSTGDFLYCGSDGVLSKEGVDGWETPLARVISFFEETDQIEGLWL